MVSAFFSPGFNDLPIDSKVRILASLSEAHLKTGHLDQIAQLVRINHPLSVQELTPLSSLCDASLERTLHGAARQIISAIEQPKLQQGRRLFQPDLGKLLEVFAVHEPS